jgi:hypothetical protein
LPGDAEDLVEHATAVWTVAGWDLVPGIAGAGAAVDRRDGLPVLH